MTTFGAGADAFGVRGEGGAAVPVVVILPGDSGAEQVKLAVEGGAPGGRRYGLEALEGRPQAAGRLRGAGPGQADLVEGEPDVAVPVQDAHGQPELPVGVASSPGRDVAVGEDAQAVIQPVQGHDGGGGILERG